MSVDFNALLSQRRNYPAQQTAARAAVDWATIQDKSTSVVFTKPKIVTKTGTTPAVELPAQTVRVEYVSRASLVEGVAGAAPQLHAVVFGVKGHPTVADSDIAEGYEFTHEGNRFRVTDVLPVQGGVQAIAVAVG